MISLIGNRPALQVGRYQVIDYDASWLDAPLRRAAEAADHGDFPFLGDIRNGIEQYLETKCALKMLPLEDLFDRLRRMLVMIGCERIAEQLEPTAPPLTFSLVRAAMEAGSGYELAFFEHLRQELTDLRAAGAEEIHFTGLRECVLTLRATTKWSRGCTQLEREIHSFLEAWEKGLSQTDAA